MLKKVLAWIGVVFFALLALAAFSMGGIVGGIIFLLLAFICSPYRYLLLDLLPEKLKKTAIVIAASVVLFFAGFLGIPTDSSTEPTEEVVERATETEVTKDIATVEQKEEKADVVKEEKNTEEVKDTVEKEDKKEADNSKKEEKTKTEKTTTNSAETSTSSDSSTKQFEITQDTSTVSEPATKEVVAETPPSEPANTSSASSTGNANAQGGGHANNFSTGTATQSGLYYIVNATNGKVHYSTCKRLPENDNQIIFQTKEEVKAAGYTDTCGICKPQLD